MTAYKKHDNSIVSVSNYAEVKPQLSLFVPNAFTPNSDGLNDYFNVSGKGITELTMQIFNRWGNLIFETNDLNEGWDGSLNGTECQQDVYVVKIKAKGNGRPVYKIASVTLIR